MLRHDTIAATQIYLGENPLRANRTMAAFVVTLGEPLTTGDLDREGAGD